MQNNPYFTEFSFLFFIPYTQLTNMPHTTLTTSVQAAKNREKRLVTDLSNRIESVLIWP